MFLAPKSGKILIGCLASIRRGLRRRRALLVLWCHASRVMDTIVGAVSGAVPADIVNRCLDQLPTLLSWPDLPDTAHRPAGGLSLTSLSA